MALPTFLMAGTIVGSVFRVDMTKVKVDVEDAIVTIDAAGCQKNIAAMNANTEEKNTSC